MSSRRVQGWDPILIICQIISLQSLHYLTLAVLLPVLLSTLTSPTFLIHQGGPSTVPTIMDWREMASRPTFDLPPAVPGAGGRGWFDLFGGAWSAGSRIGDGAAGNGGLELEEEVGKAEVGWVDDWDGMVDRRRGWVIAGAWALAVGVDVMFLYQFVRRPTHILDHATTLAFNHVVLTTYFARAFPASVFFWLVLGASTATTVLWAERLCVRREMHESMGDWSGSAPPGAAEEGAAGGGNEAIPLTARGASS